jgi:hypothetical protein
VDAAFALALAAFLDAAVTAVFLDVRLRKTLRDCAGCANVPTIPTGADFVTLVRVLEGGLVLRVAGRVVPVVVLDEPEPPDPPPPLWWCAVVGGVV